MGDLRGDHSAEVNLSAFRNLVLRQVLEYRQKYVTRFGEMVICADGNDYWRRQVFPYYKFSRKKSKADSDYDWEAIKSCQHTILEELRRFFPYPVIETPSAEADDVIAIMAEYTQGNELDTEGLFSTPKDTVIISADTDFVQLSKWKNIKQFCPMKREQVKTDLPLNRFCLEHILTGDTGDGIMNVNTHDNFFYDKEQNPDLKVRQKPITAKIKDFYYEQWKKHGKIDTWLQPEHEVNFARNERLVMFEHIPQHVKDSVLESYHKQLGKGRGKILPYLSAARLTNLISECDNF